MSTPQPIDLSGGAAASSPRSLTQMHKDMVQERAKRELKYISQNISVSELQEFKKTTQESLEGANKTLPLVQEELDTANHEVQQIAVWFIEQGKLSEKYTSSRDTLCSAKDDMLVREYERACTEEISQTVPFIEGLEHCPLLLSGNNHCVYKAIAVCMDLTEGALYDLVDRYVKENSDPNLNDIIRHGRQTIEEYVESHRAMKETNDDLDISVISYILKRPIAIIDHQGFISRKSQLIYKKGDPIFIFYNGKYYEPYKVRPDYDASNIFTGLVQKRFPQEVRIEDLCITKPSGRAGKKRGLARPLQFNALMMNQSAE